MADDEITSTAQPGYVETLTHNKPMLFTHGRHKIAVIDKVEYSGIFDWEGLYALMRAFFLKRRYITTENNTKYKRSRFGFHYENDWQAWRKVTSYFKYHIKIYFRIWDLEEVEVIKDGKKKKMYRGRLFIEIRPELESDYQGRFSKTPWLKKVKDWMETYVMKRELEFRHWDYLYYEAIKLRDEIKRHLNMQLV